MLLIMILAGLGTGDAVSDGTVGWLAIVFVVVVPIIIAVQMGKREKARKESESNS